jgi:hypothetical protein
VADHFSKFAAVPIASRVSEVEVTVARSVLGFLKSDPKKPENVPKTGPFSRKKKQQHNTVLTMCCVVVVSKGRIFQLPSVVYFWASKELAHNGTRGMNAHILLLKWREDDVGASRNCPIHTGCFTHEQAQSFVYSTGPQRKVHQRTRWVP